MWIGFDGEDNQERGVSFSYYYSRVHWKKMPRDNRVISLVLTEKTAWEGKENENWELAVGI